MAHDYKQTYNSINNQKNSKKIKTNRTKSKSPSVNGEFSPPTAKTLQHAHFHHHRDHHHRRDDRGKRIACVSSAKLLSPVAFSPHRSPFAVGPRADADADAGPPLATWTPTHEQLLKNTPTLLFYPLFHFPNVPFNIPRPVPFKERDMSALEKVGLVSVLIVAYVATRKLISFIYRNFIGPGARKIDFKSLGQWARECCFYFRFLSIFVGFFRRA